jgi:hypothetical protein
VARLALGWAGWRAPATTVVAGVLTAMTLSGAPAAAAVPSSLPAESRVEERAAEVAAAGARVDALSSAVGQALEDYQVAERAKLEAQLRQLHHTQQLGDSDAALRDARSDLGEWARQAYQSGGEAGQLAAALHLFSSGSTADLGHDLATLHSVTAGQTVVVDQAVVAQGQKKTAAALAESARTTALAAAARAETARSRSEELLAAQRLELAKLEALLLDEKQAAERRAQQARALARAKAAAEARRVASLKAPSPLVQQYFSASNGCQGADLSQWPNGGIPAEALCPLWGQPRHLLRADAAAAFEHLSKAWAADHGAPICVTDSYRPYADQVRLAITKPTLAARPGTSNHGWGVALDMCGGIQGFGTEAHQWMIRNAPRFGWFHPRWAQQGGSKPEAWHWEFAG